MIWQSNSVWNTFLLILFVKISINILQNIVNIFYFTKMSLSFLPIYLYLVDKDTNRNCSRNLSLHYLFRNWFDGNPVGFSLVLALPLALPNPKLQSQPAKIVKIIKTKTGTTVLRGTNACLY